MDEREELDEAEQPVDQTFTWPLLGALYGSLVIVASWWLCSRRTRDAASRTRSMRRLGRWWRRRWWCSPAVVFLASMVALIVPGYRRRSLRVAEIAAWLIPAWLVMSAMGIGAVAFALHHAD